MTAKERAKPEIVNAKRKIRIAKGSGTTVQEINKLLKMHQEMASAMKRLKKMGGFSKLAAMFSKGGLEGALGGLAPPERCRRAGWAAPDRPFRVSADRISTCHPVSTSSQRNKRTY